MKRVPINSFYQTLFKNAFVLPHVAKDVLYDRLDIVRINIADKMQLKINLIRLYAMGDLAFLAAAIFGDTILALIGSCLLTWVIIVIGNDLGEISEMDKTIDKLREPDVDSYNPAPISPFWY